MKKSIAVIMLAMLAIGSFSLIPRLAQADTEVDRTWARTRGIINQWGNTPVFGWIGADAYVANINGTVHEWARAFAMWSDQPRLLNCTPTPENFTFSFYLARLTNSTEIGINVTGYDLFIAGNWTVVKTTITITVYENGEPMNITRTLETVVADAYGEFKVPTVVQPAVQTFELSIAGIDKVSGIVRMQMISHFEIKLFDVDGDGKVDIHELVKAAERYRAVPGLWNYDFNLDFNGDGSIDIGDLTTIAANIEG